MPFYQYYAVSLDGKKKIGKAEAADPCQLYHTMKAAGLYVVFQRKLNVEKKTIPMGASRLSALCRRLASMLNAGIALTQAVDLLCQKEKSRGMARALSGLYRELVKGNSFSEALKSQNGAFPLLMVNMFRAGEESGKLGESASRLADYYEKESRMQKGAVSALAYPAFLLLLSLFSLVVVFTLVLPSFFDLFETMEELPGSTRFLISLSRFLVKDWPNLLIGLAAMICIGAYLAGKSRIKKQLGKSAIKLPVWGVLLQLMDTARFARTLSSLYKNGVSLTYALEIAAGTVKNPYLLSQFPIVTARVQDGGSLSSALEDVDGLDSRLSSCVYIGEESGSLGPMLDSVADSLDNEADETAKRLTALAEPVMIVVMAAFVGYIMISVMLPVYQYYQGIG